jgi:hypothetical protein
MILTIVLNYEIVGKANWEALKSFHHLGIAMLILYGLLLKSNGTAPQHQQPLGSGQPAPPSLATG